MIININKIVIMACNLKMINDIVYYEREIISSYGWNYNCKFNMQYAKCGQYKSILCRIITTKGKLTILML